MNDSRINIGPKTFAGIVWTSFGTLGHGAVQLLTLVLLARLLTPEDFGLAAAALIVLALGALFAQIGVSPAIVQRHELENRHIVTGFALSMWFGLILGLLVYLNAQAIGDLMRMDGLVPVIQVIALAFPVQGFAVVSEALLQRELKFRALAVALVLSQLLGFGLVACMLAMLGWGAMSLAIASVVQLLMRSTMLVALRRHALWGFDGKAAKELLYFGGGHTIAKLGNQIALQGDFFVTGRWLGAEALGLYTRTYQLMSMPAAVIGTALDKVLFPSMSRLQHDTEELSRWFIQASGAIALVILPVSAVSFVLAPEIVLVLLGDQWTGMTLALQIFAFGMMFRTSYKISDTLAKAKGAVYRRAWRQSLYALAVVLGAWIGQHWGIEGVAAGVLGAVIFNFLLMSQLSLTLVGLRWGAFAKVHLAPLLLSIVTGAICLALATLARYLTVHPFVTLVLTGLAILATATLLARARPKVLLGAEGLWLIDNIQTNLRHSRSKSK